MKPTETKLEYVKARAEGKSYSTIQEELGISKATCSNWEKELKADVEALKSARLEELYASYNMTREARIRTLGQIVNRLDTEIEKQDMSTLSLDRQLELRLKYARELRAEYREPVNTETDNTLEGLLEEYNQIYIDSKTGSLSPADVKAQLAILDAKRDIIYKISGEQEKEETDPLALNLEYKSRVLRHSSQIGSSKWK